MKLDATARMVTRRNLKQDSDVTTGSQKLLMEAGYQPKPDWIYIDDLVQQFRSQPWTSEEMLSSLTEFLASAPSPVTR